MLDASRRASAAYEAVVERVIEEHLKPDVLNLAPGTAHWAPPDDVMPSSWSVTHSRYSACQGTDALLLALKDKLELDGHDMDARKVMVTNGANQAYASTLITLCDPGDEVRP